MRVCICVLCDRLEVMSILVCVCVCVYVCVYLYWYLIELTLYQVLSLIITACCICSVIFPVSNLSRCSSSLGLFCHVPLDEDTCDAKELYKRDVYSAKELYKRDVYSLDKDTCD